MNEEQTEDNAENTALAENETEACVLMSLTGLLLLLVVSHTSEHREAPWCGDFRITGYVRTAGNAQTFDGTSVYSEEPFLAASWDIPINSMVLVEGLGAFRVADRGRLGPNHLDIPVWSRAEAYQLTGTRQACVFPPGF